MGFSSVLECRVKERKRLRGRHSDGGGGKLLCSGLPVLTGWKWFP